MDTTVTVTLYAASKKEAKDAFALCRETLSDLDGRWAKEKPDSLVSKINEAGSETISLDGETAQLLEKALAVSRATEGIFDVTVEPHGTRLYRCKLTLK